MKPKELDPPPPNRCRGWYADMSQPGWAPLLVTVIGLGAIGREVALQLGALGVRRLQLIDPGRITADDVTRHGFWPRDCGKLKGHVVRSALQCLTANLRVDVICDCYRPQRRVGEAVFFCVDRALARTVVWKWLGTRTRFWCDGHARGESVRVLSATDIHSQERYVHAVFATPATGPVATPSDPRTAVFTARIAAGIMVHEFSRWIRRIPVHREVGLDLLAGEWTLV